MVCYTQTMIPLCIEVGKRCVGWLGGNCLPPK